jgi:hypothetical protein
MKISLIRNKAKAKWDVTVDGEFVGEKMTREVADALVRKIAT